MEKETKENLADNCAEIMRAVLEGRATLREQRAYDTMHSEVIWLALFSEKNGWTREAAEALITRLAFVENFEGFTLPRFSHEIDKNWAGALLPYAKLAVCVCSTEGYMRNEDLNVRFSEPAKDTAARDFMLRLGDELCQRALAVGLNPRQTLVLEHLGRAVFMALDADHPLTDHLKLLEEGAPADNERFRDARRAVFQMAVAVSERGDLKNAEHLFNIAGRGNAGFAEKAAQYAGLVVKFAATSELAGLFKDAQFLQKVHGQKWAPAAPDGGFYGHVA